MRGRVRITPLATPPDRSPDGAHFGDVAQDVQSTYKPGDLVAAQFWTGNPRNGYQRGVKWAVVERSVGNSWQPVAADGDWSIKIRWTQPRDKRPGNRRLASHQLAVEWQVPADLEPGMYRIIHLG